MGHHVVIFYAGDGDPGPLAHLLPPEVPLFIAGSSLAGLEEMWRDDWLEEEPAAPTIAESRQ